MGQPKWEIPLDQLVEAKDIDVIKARFDEQENMRREYECRCKEMATNQTDKLKKQVEEKEATISALLKCIRLLGGEADGGI